MRSKVDGVSEDGAVEQNQRLGLGVWGVVEVREVAVGSQAANDGRAGRGGNGMTLVVYGDFAIIADADTPQAQFGGGHVRRQSLGAMLGQEVTNERSRKALN